MTLDEIANSLKADDARVVLADLQATSVEYAEVPAGVHQVAVAPDGRLAVSVSDDGSLIVWDLEARSAVAAWFSEGAFITCAAASDGRHFVAGDRLGQVHILELVGL